ncbi:hypothetical protein TSOC_001388 [Tetrabaena socialis]|uniref:NYN domain-containing protein n=1 Tax=Tetrabaena socialis TaxID=47790 RepID=A0A2J8AH06_9CHLO|nr:hypothetical protein TSOC_001388 [Tetrabaena socialis]|eukprot:PNH11776.1 hypothetical protein TSOC_001388 [Tetrabaena socialis]
MGCVPSRSAEEEGPAHHLPGDTSKAGGAASKGAASEGGASGKHVRHDGLNGAASGSAPYTPPHTPLARVSAAPSTDGRSLCLIVWDIENVRLPLNTAPGLSPKHVVRYLKKHFIYAPCRTEYRTVAAVTERSLNRIRRDHPSFVEQVIPDLTLLMASAQHAKRNADVVLKKELHMFCMEHAHTARCNPGQLTIVLISGDEDFLEPVQAALQAGFGVELLTHDTASGALLAQGYSHRPTLWSAFLRACSGVQQVVLPYGDEQMHALLRPRSLIVAGFGPKRGGEVARGLVVRLLHEGAAAADGSAAALGVQGAGAAGAEAEVLLVEPSFGEYSGSCCVLVCPAEGQEAAALTHQLRQRGAGGVGGGGGGGGWGGGGGGGGGGQEARLVVFEARRVLRLVLQADDMWTPVQEQAAAAAQAITAAAADEEEQEADGDDGDGGEPTTHSSAIDDQRQPSYNAAAGRGLSDRMADACERLAAMLRQYRVPTANRHQPPPQAHTNHHQPWRQPPPTQLQLLCRFSRVPGPGELATTLLLSAADEQADLLAALSHLREAAPELARQHGVAMLAECMFAGEAVSGPGAQAERVPVAEVGLGAPVAQVAVGAPRRLPSLPFRPSGGSDGEDGWQQVGAAAGPAGQADAEQAGLQNEVQSFDAQDGAGAAEQGVGQAAALPGTASVAAVHAATVGATGGPRGEGNSSTDGSSKWKKRKKRKNKRRNKRNSVVPL